MELLLEELSIRFPNLPAEAGRLMANAAIVCLDASEHHSGIEMLVAGDFREACVLRWLMPISDAMRRYWNDMEDATEQGAYGIAILLVRQLTGLSIVERSRKGTGFDWWLGSEDNLFQAKACLEVSGILRGSSKRVNARAKARLQQMDRSEYLGLPGFVTVVEFGRPQARVVQHERNQGASS